MSDDVKQQAYLSPGDIAALIRLHGLTLAGNSPLVTFVEAEEQVPQASLNQRGLHRAAWRDALAVLAAPARQVRVQIPAPAESFTAIYYGHPSGNGRSDSDALVGCWLEEDGLRVSFPWAHEQLLALGWQTLLATTLPPADELSLTLGLPGLTALAAAVDSLRAQLFRSYLYRETDVPLVLTRAGLAEQLELGLGKADSRWLVTLLNLAGSPHFPLEPQELPEGVTELAAAGLLFEDGEDWQPSPGLQRLALQWRSPLPAFALESLEVGADGRLQQYGHRLIIRGDGPLWQIDYGATAWQAAPQVTLTGVNPRDCFDGLAQLLAAPTAVPKSPQPGADVTTVDGMGLAHTMVAAAPISCHLAVRQGALAGQQFPLGKTVTLGRSPDNTICLDDQKVSRHHARIKVENGHCFIEDLGSSNGTFLNGERIRQAALLKPGDRVQISDQILEVVGAEPALSAATATVIRPAPPLEPERAVEPPSPLTCPHCHQPIGVGARFCRHCGRSVAA